MYQVKLEKVFEGPFDLLLFLVRKHEVDIYNIPIVKITDEYLAYLEKMKELNLNIASEFIVIAATLCYLKSRALLPFPEEEEEAESPEKKLIWQLEEYQKYRAISENLQQMELEEGNIFTRANGNGNGHREEEEIIIFDLNLYDLLSAFQEVIRKRKPEIREIIQDEWTVEEKINFILERLKEEKVLDFTQLFEECYSRLELIVSFLALLELLKLGRIRVRQFGAFGRIKIFFSAGEKKKSFRPHLVGREMNEEVRPSVHQH